MKQIYKDGMLSGSVLSEEEAEFYRSLKDGISVTPHAIRSVATEGNWKHILELRANEVNRTRVRMKNDE